MDKKNILAIDVGTGTIKVFAGRQLPDGSISLAGSGSAPTEGYVKGVIADVGALANSIRQAVDCVVMASDSQTSDYVYLGISGSMLSSQNRVGSVALSSPESITSEDIKRACQAAVFSGMPDDLVVLHALPVRETLIGTGEQTIDGQGTGIEVVTHIITAPKAIITELSANLSDGGLRVDGVVASGVVAAESLKCILSDQPANFIFMDIGAGTTDIVVYLGGKLCLSAWLPLGGDYITGDIMQGLNVSRPHAEEIKRYYARLDRNLRGQDVILDCNDYGTTDKHIPFDFLYDIVESRVDEIITLVYDHLRPMLESEVSQSGQTINSILLTGGCGSMPSMTACAARVFNINAQAVKPDQLAPEYAHPFNTACFGIISHAAKSLPCDSNGSHSAWQVVMRNVKKFFKI